MSQPISEFLKDRVYPQLDAVEAGLLDNLKPSHLLAGGHYKLACPGCSQREAFYYPRKAYVSCNRKNKCGKAYSLWDILELEGIQGREIINRLCKAVNVQPPERESPPRHAQNGQHTSQASTAGQEQHSPQASVSPGKAIFQVTQSLARNNPELLKRLQAERKYTDKQMEQMRLGVYTTPDEVLSGLLSLGVSREIAIAKGYIEVDSDDPSKLTRGLTNRVVGYWPQPDDDIRLWGRLAEGKGDQYNKKYRFALSLVKDIPYLYSQRRQTILCLIEGTFDAWALHFMGYWSGSIGGASVTSAQASYLASQGVTEACLIIDGDDAGYDGAVVSIRNLESLGITTSVVALGVGMDDPDAMRQTGRDKHMAAMIDARINSGEFLARICGAYMNRPTPHLKGIRRVQALVPSLTPPSRRIWTDFSLSLAIPQHTHLTAIRLLAAMVESGMEFREAALRVQDRTSFLFSLEDQNDG